MPDYGRWTSNGGDPSLNDVNRVDRFFDALGSKETAYSTDRAEAELAFLFADWRDEVRDAPVTAQITSRDAVDALESGLGTRRSRRGSLFLVGSAAAAVLCAGGFGAAVYSAGPGDSFYGIRTTLFGAQTTRDDGVVLAAQTEMQQVQQLIDNGQWEQAQDKLVALSSTVESVETPQQKQELVQQYNQLTVKVAQQDPAATLPPDAPLPTFSGSPLTLLPVPTFQFPDGSTTSSSSSTTTTTSSSSETTSTSETSTTPSTPGPEILLTTPPTPTTPSPAESSASTPTPSATATTSTSAAPSSTTPSTATTAAPAPSSAKVSTTTRVEVTSITSLPSSAPQLAPPSSAVPPPVVEKPAPAPVEKPAPAEVPSSATKAPEQTQAPVTTTVVPPG